MGSRCAAGEAGSRSAATDRKSGRTATNEQILADGDASGSRVGLRIAALIVEPVAYRLVADWVARQGHRLVLLVTTPGPPRGRQHRDYLDLIATVPPEQDILVSTRMRRTVGPALAALAPDLLVSFTFPYRIPPEVAAIPRHGAVNLHPTPLPRYRGPNPRRMLFDGVPTLGATLHRIEAGFDTGAILACREVPLPADPTSESVLATWTAALAEALEAGTRRAVAGEWGKPQDESLASYAAPFTPEERRLDWAWPAVLLQRRVLALSLFRPEAEATIDGMEHAVHRVTPRPGPAPAAPGTLLHRAGDRFTLAVGDGVVEVVATERRADEAAASTGHLGVKEWTS